ncbi:hypothetical protein ACFLQZ_02870 [Acidobacteriota bacterium]
MTINDKTLAVEDSGQAEAASPENLKKRKRKKMFDLYNFENQGRENMSKGG